MYPRTVEALLHAKTYDSPRSSVLHYVKIAGRRIEKDRTKRRVYIRNDNKWRKNERGRTKEELSFTNVNPRTASVFHSALQNELVWVKKHVCMRASRASEYPCCDTVSLLPLLSLSSHPCS